MPKKEAKPMYVPQKEDVVSVDIILRIEVHALGDDIDDEMQRYLKEVELNFRKDDPMTWWKCHETSFPIISKLARKYLVIPASTAPSQRVFSTAKKKMMQTFAKSAQ